MAASFIGNRVGRRPFLIFASVFTLIGAAGQAGAVDLGMFIAFRIINGIAVGILTSIVPSFVAEISKPRIRGLMMSLELCFAATGVSFAQPRPCRRRMKLISFLRVNSSCPLSGLRKLLSTVHLSLLLRRLPSMAITATVSRKLPDRSDGEFLSPSKVSSSSSLSSASSSCPSHLDVSSLSQLDGSP